ncbi:MAG: hypothetical protein RSB41_00480 [Bacilli bacterium]
MESIMDKLKKHGEISTKIYNRENRLTTNIERTLVPNKKEQTLLLKKDKIVEVYSVFPNNELLKQKKEEYLSTKKTKEVYKKLLISRKDTLWEKTVTRKPILIQGDKLVADLEDYSSLAKREEDLLIDYVVGENPTVGRIILNDKANKEKLYLAYLSRLVAYRYSFDIYVQEDVLLLNEELYNLSILQRGELSNLTTKELMLLADFFTLEKTGEENIEQVLNDPKTYGLRNTQELIEKLDNDASILKLAFKNR